MAPRPNAFPPPAFPPPVSPPAAPVFPSVRAPSSPGFDPFPMTPPPRPGRESLSRLGGGPRPLGGGAPLGGGGAAIAKTSAGDDGRGSDVFATIPGWRRTRGGLFWVMLGLLMLTAPGIVGFAKAACLKGGVELPKGPGEGWITIAGYVNTSEAGAIKLSKEELVDLVAYGVPLVFGGLFLGFGRLTCGAAPRSSGAKGMFALSGLFTLIAVAALVGSVACFNLFPEEYPYTRYALLISLPAAEFWFLTGLAVSGVTLKRPGAAKAVGFLVLIVTFAATAATMGWLVYAKQTGRPLLANANTKFYEQAVLMLSWLVVIGVYWRAVRSVRGAISDLLEAVEG